MHIKIRNGFSVAILLICFLLLSVKSVMQTPKTDFISQNFRMQIPRNTVVASPIIINGSDPNQNWTNCSWVSGSGTWNDPFLLQNLFINANGSEAGIMIEETDQFFQIINCTVFYGGLVSYWKDSQGAFGYNPDSGGIVLISVTNGYLLNDVCLNNTLGINLISSSNNTITLNTCTENLCSGLFAELSASNIFTFNNCTDNDQSGVEIDSSSNNTLLQNYCMDNNFEGIIFESSYLYNLGDVDSSNSLISQNICAENGQDGIEIQTSSNNTLNQNDCYKNFLDGMGLGYLLNSTISQNNCTRNYMGIDFSGSSNNLSQNNCTFNGVDGILIYASSSNNVIIQNNCTNDQDQGIWLEPEAYNQTNAPSFNNISINTCAKELTGIEIDPGSASNLVFQNYLLCNTDNIDDSGTNDLVYDNFLVASSPQNVQITLDIGHVILAWQAPSNNYGIGIVGYNVYRGTTAGAEILYASIGNVTSWTDSNLTFGQTYYYVITAVNSLGESQNSTEISAPITFTSYFTIPLIMIALIVEVIATVYYLKQRKKKHSSDLPFDGRKSDNRTISTDSGTNYEQLADQRRQLFAQRRD